MDYKKEIIKLVSKIDNCSELKRIYNLVNYIFVKNKDILFFVVMLQLL